MRGVAAVEGPPFVNLSPSPACRRLRHPLGATATPETELLFNRRNDELHHRHVAVYTLELQPPVQVLRDTGRKLRPAFFLDLRHRRPLLSDLRDNKDHERVEEPVTSASTVSAVSARGFVLHVVTPGECPMGPSE